MALVNVTDEFMDRFRHELEKHELAGEDIYWDATILPGPEQAPVAFVTIGIAGSVLGTRIQLGFMIGSPSLVPDADLTRLVLEAIETLRTSRSQQLIEQGNPQAAGGLILGSK